MHSPNVLHNRNAPLVARARACILPQSCRERSAPRVTTVRRRERATDGVVVGGRSTCRSVPLGSEVCITRGLCSSSQTEEKMGGGQRSGPKPTGGGSATKRKERRATRFPGLPVAAGGIRKPKPGAPIPRPWRRRASLPAGERAYGDRDDDERVCLAARRVPAARGRRLRGGGGGRRASGRHLGRAVTATTHVYIAPATHHPRRSGCSTEVQGGWLQDDPRQQQIGS